LARAARTGRAFIKVARAGQKVARK
jgi:hypothetical protein